MKILYLILAGGDSSHTQDIVSTRNSWVKALPSGSSHFELYADPKLTNTEIRSHEIWANCGFEYSDILRKTIISLRALGPVLEDFDYIVRTNVSSYFDHSKVEKLLFKYKELEYFYGGYVMESKAFPGKRFPYVSGAAVFWNSETAKLVSTINPDEFNDYPDDVVFSKFLENNGVKITFLPRGNICSHGFFTISSHYRLKSSDYAELAGIRINSYHKFTLEKNYIQKINLLIKHQKLEFSYLKKMEVIFHLANCWQVLKIYFRYKITNK
jgi:hypothetical protein